MNVGLLEQFAADGFAGAACEEHVVGEHHGGAAVLLEDGGDMLVRIKVRLQSPGALSRRFLQHRPRSRRLGFSRADLRRDRSTHAR